MTKVKDKLTEEMKMNKNGKPSRNLKLAGGLVATAAAATLASMAYVINEEKISAEVKKAAEKAKESFGKASDKLREKADEFKSMIDEEPEVVEDEVVDVEFTTADEEAAVEEAAVEEPETDVCQDVETVEENKETE